MIIVDCAQGGREWFDARKGIPTASCFGRFLKQDGTAANSKERVSYMCELLAERLTGEQTKHFTTDAMIRGTMTEPQARAWYEVSHGRAVKQVGFVYRDEARRCGCSPDGLIYDGDKLLRGLEIKVPLPHTQIRYLLNGVVPDEYTLQVQGSMWVCGVREWAFVSYAPESGIPNLVLTILADDAIHAAMDESIPAFCDQLDAAEKKLRAALGDKRDTGKAWWED